MSLLRVMQCTTGLGAFAVIGLSPLGCSDPVPPPFQGAYVVNFGNSPTGGTCPLDKSRSVGVATETQKSTVIDGENGASVSCRVAPNGAGYAVSARIALGRDTLNVISAQLTPDVVENGRLNVIVGSDTYVLGDGGDCQFTLIDGAPGRIWGTMSCDHLEEQSNPLQAGCSMGVGSVFVFENCDEV